MLRSCNECPSLSDLKQFLLDIFDEHEIENVIYNQWQKEKKKSCNIAQISTSVEDFVNEVCKQAKLLCEQDHHIKNSQAAYFKHLK